MKICFLHKLTFQMPRSIETLMISLANELTALGDEVTIVAMRGKLTASLELDNRVRVVAHPSARYYEVNAAQPFYQSTLADTRFDLVVLFCADFGEAHTRTMQRMLRNQPFLIYLCYPLNQAPHHYYAFKESQLSVQAAAIVAESEYIAASASNFFDRRVGVIPPGINPLNCYPNPMLGQELRHNLGINPHTKVLLTIAALEERNGIQSVLRSLPQMLAQIPDLQYVVVGAGPHEAELQALTISLGLTATVRFVGITRNLLPYYNMADLLVLTARNGGSSATYLEAMACGRPLVVARAGNFNEELPSGVGWRVPLDDEAQLANALLSALRDPQAAAMGAQARQHALRYCTWAARAREFRQLCAQFAAEPVLA